jgi:hypothetical protein
MLPMKILHGTWIPQTEDGFIQTGAFYLWVETTEETKTTKKQKSAQNRHPSHLHASDLESFLGTD